MPATRTRPGGPRHSAARGWLPCSSPRTGGAVPFPAQVSASRLQRETLLRQLETNQLDIDATLEELSVQQETEDQNYGMYGGPGGPGGRACGQGSVGRGHGHPQAGALAAEIAGAVPPGPGRAVGLGDARGSSREGHGARRPEAGPRGGGVGTVGPGGLQPVGPFAEVLC